MDFANASCLEPTTGTAPATFAAAIQYFAAAQCLLNEDPIPDSKVEDGATYDFIIVGGGTAGSVVANRLSEVRKWKILVIEAGLPSPLEAKIPGMDKGLFHTKYDWEYYTQDNGVTNKANKNNSVYWPRGKMTGGSANINGMIYSRGSTLDYKKLSDNGVKGWTTNVVNECFKKAENLQDPNLTRYLRYRNYYGHKGPLPISTFNSTIRHLTDKVLQSWNEIGIYNVLDLNSANTLGSGIVRVTAANGRRQSTEHAYLTPARQRNNLDVITNALVTKVLIDEYTKEAHGVEVDVDDKIIKISAAKEIIICAGTINTPQLLMLSGVGPKEHLESHEIKTIVDLPAVGNYLQDHSIVPVVIKGTSPDEQNEAEKHLDEIKYIYNQTGYLAQNSFTDIVAHYSIIPRGYALFQSHLNIFRKKSKALPNYLNFIARYEDIVVQSMLRQNENNSLYWFLFTLLHPLSKGQITLKSTNPREYPLIFANYFNNTQDIDEAIEGIQRLTKIVNTRYFKSINGRIARMSWPECDIYELDSKPYWKCIIINMCISVYHPIGTARMGNDTETSAVNSELQVHVVKKLRIADASVMPSQISSNIQGPVIMIAERLSGLIKKYYDISLESDDLCY